MCLNPITLRNPAFDPKSKGFHREMYFTVPCGHCPECHKKKQSNWFIRASFQYACKQYNGKAVYITLTYNDKYVPIRFIPETSECFSSINRKDISDFFKRLRKQTSKENRPISYYGCCEYGGKKGRPHAHLVIFGLDGSDKHDCDLIRAAWADRGANGRISAKKSSKRSYGRIEKVGNQKFNMRGHVDICPNKIGQGLLRYLTKYMITPDVVKHDEFVNPRWQDVEEGFITKPCVVSSHGFGLEALNAQACKQLFDFSRNLNLDSELSSNFLYVCNCLNTDGYKNISELLAVDNKSTHSLWTIYDRFNIRFYDKTKDPNKPYFQYAVPQYLRTKLYKKMLDSGISIEIIRNLQFLFLTFASVDRDIELYNRYIYEYNKLHNTNFGKVTRDNFTEFLNSDSCELILHNQRTLALVSDSLRDGTNKRLKDSLSQTRREYREMYSRHTFLESDKETYIWLE